MTNRHAVSNVTPSIRSSRRLGAPYLTRYTEEEAVTVRDVLLSNRVNYWTGSECRQFEQAFAAWAGVDYAVALDVALKVLGIGDGDAVIVTPLAII